MGHPAAQREIGIDFETAPWPVNELLAAERPINVVNLSELFSELPTGVWDKPPSQARLVPIARKGQEKPAGVFIAALNPYRQLDSSYAGFLD